jgi:1-acyl-sn-glycerol-3-phosphate acyltransferase
MNGLTQYKPIPQNKSIPSAEHQTLSKNQRKNGDSSLVVIFFKKLRRVAHNYKDSVVKAYAWVVQILIWFILWPTLHARHQINVHGKENIRGLSGPLIIAVNHQRFYDAFLLRLAVGFYSPLLPLRFMGTIEFNDRFLKFVKMTGFVHFLYATTGVFVVHRGLGLNKNLVRAREIIRKGGVVAIMPEGKMNKNGEMSQFKRGIAALALSTNTRVLPVGIKISKGGGIRGIVDIYFQSAEYLRTGETYENLAEELRGKINSHIFL